LPPVPAVIVPPDPPVPPVPPLPPVPPMPPVPPLPAVSVPAVPPSVPPPPGAGELQPASLARARAQQEITNALVFIGTTSWLAGRTDTAEGTPRGQPQWARDHGQRAVVPGS